MSDREDAEKWRLLQAERLIRSERPVRMVTVPGPFSWLWQRPIEPLYELLRRLQAAAERKD